MFSRLFQINLDTNVLSESTTSGPSNTINNTNNPDYDKVETEKYLRAK